MGIWLRERMVELGDICVNYNETEPAGNVIPGSLEYYTSATGIVRMAKRKLNCHNGETVLVSEEVTAKAVFDAAKSGDVVAIEVAEEFGCYLGHTLENLVAVLEPEIFIIGGGVSKAGEILLDYIYKYYHAKVPLTLAKLGNDAGMYGAVRLGEEINQSGFYDKYKEQKCLCKENEK